MRDFIRDNSWQIISLYLLISIIYIIILYFLGRRRQKRLLFEIQNIINEEESIILDKKSKAKVIRKTPLKDFKENAVKDAKLLCNKLKCERYEITVLRGEIEKYKKKNENLTKNSHSAYSGDEGVAELERRNKDLEEEVERKKEQIEREEAKILDLEGYKSNFDRDLQVLDQLITSSDANMSNQPIDIQHKVDSFQIDEMKLIAVSFRKKIDQLAECEKRIDEIKFENEGRINDLKSRHQDEINQKKEQFVATEQAYKNRLSEVEEDHRNTVDRYETKLREIFPGSFLTEETDDLVNILKSQLEDPERSEKVNTLVGLIFHAAGSVGEINCPDVCFEASRAFYEWVKGVDGDVSALENTFASWLTECVKGDGLSVEVVRVGDDFSDRRHVSKHPGHEVRKVSSFLIAAQDGKAYKKAMVVT